MIIKHTSWLMVSKGTMGICGMQSTNIRAFIPITPGDREKCFDDYRKSTGATYAQPVSKFTYWAIKKEK